MSVKGYNDPDHIGNSAKYHTGKPCIEDGCIEPAGTAWSSHWCFRHNVERIDKVTEGMKRIIAGMKISTK